MEKIYKDNEFMEYPKEKRVYNLSIEAIPIELYEQVKGERDIAIEQLKALNIELFEKPYLKAIPIEWVIELSNRLKNDEDDFEKAMFLLDLVDLWEYENERDV